VGLLLLALAAGMEPASSQRISLHSVPMHAMDPLSSIFDRSSASSYFLKHLDAMMDTATAAAAHHPSHTYAELLGVGCTPVQTLHKSLSHTSNETTIQLFVSRTCSRPDTATVPLTNISAKATDQGELLVRAIPEGSARGFEQSFALPRHAIVTSISAAYDEETSVLRVSVPLSSTPTNVEVPISTIAAPQRHERMEQAGEDELQQAAISVAPAELAAPPSPPKETPEQTAQRERFVAAQILELQKELDRIKGHSSAPIA